MQERVLGGIIIGGIALFGVVWAVVEGSINLAVAQDNEKKLDNKISEVVKEYADLSKVDVNVASYYTQTERVKEPVLFDEDGNPIRWSTVDKVIPYVSVYGKTSSGEVYTVTFRGNNKFVRQIDDRKVDLVKNTDRDEFITLDINSAKLTTSMYKNYSLTTSSVILDLIEEDGVLADFSVGSTEYLRRVFDINGNVVEEYINGQLQ